MRIAVFGLMAVCLAASSGLAEEREIESATFDETLFDDVASEDGDDHHGDVKHGRVDTHAPAHLFGEHVHKQGEWMFEYKFLSMYMDGNRSGTTDLTDDQALDFIGTVPPDTPGVSAYGATPTSMTMEMHMIHVMYGLTDDVTLYIMPMWMVNTMDHNRRPGTPPFNNLGPTFRTANTGIGDLHFGGLWRVYEGCTDEVILNIGFSGPTGDIDARTSVPTGSPGEFPYPMRLGSGTWDARPGITYRSYSDWWSLGLQFQTDVPMGRNSSGYRVGEEYRANAWFSWLLDCEKKYALTYRVEGLWRNNYDGADAALNPNLVSTADPQMRGGELLNFGYGAMALLPWGGRLNLELSHPIYQRLDGVQLETDWSLAASYSKAILNRKLPVS